MSPTKDKRKTATGKTASRAFTAEERAAMQDRVRELKSGQSDGEADLLAKISAMQESDRVLATQFHAIVTANAPGLSPTTWYGMPAYSKDGKVFCHFQSAQKFKTRYATIGFSDKAKLDDGGLWPTAFALKEMNAAVEAKIAALLKKAVK